jgi:GT2 family glycosyltransferase
MSRLRVNAVVVAFDGGDALRRCICALLSSTYQPLEILVVDNGSVDPDATAELASLSENVAVVLSRRNLGFAGGVNFAMRWFLERGPRADIYALVNQDCFVRPGWLGPLVATLSAEPRVAVVGSRIYEADGRTLQHAGGVIHPNGLTDHIGRGCEDDAAYRDRIDVDYVTGALCAFRAGAWDRFGPMDAAYYPAYFEEADFCVRARAAGLRVVYVPESEAIHQESTTLGRGTNAQLMVYHRNRMRFAARHLSRAGVRGPALTCELRWLFSGHGAGQVSALARAYPALAGDLLRSWRQGK